MKLTFKLLSDILRIFKYNGIINIYWRGKEIKFDEAINYIAF